MKTLGIEIDGIIRDFYGQFDKQYRKVYVYNSEQIEMNDNFTPKELTEEEEKELIEKTKIKAMELISLPINTGELLNHYRFEQKKIKMTGDILKTEEKYGAVSDGNIINENQDDIIVTPEEGIKKFMFDEYPFQIFGNADPLGDAMNQINQIQRIGEMSELFNVVLFSNVGGQAMPATYFFLSRNHCRVRNLKFIKEGENKWDFCDALVDINPQVIEATPSNKVSIKIEHPSNEWSEAEYKFKSIKELNNSKILKEIFKTKLVES